MNVSTLGKISGLFIITPGDDKRDSKGGRFVSLAKNHIIKSSGAKRDIAKNFDTHLYE